jgi:hypothetical protein
MPRAEESVRAIGRLAPEGTWVGIEPAVDGYRLVFGLADGLALRDPTADPFERRAGLVAAAIAFFLASLADPPAELEATQADLAHLVGSLSGDTREVLDAIDDGLSGEAVAIRLQRLLPARADATRILRDRYTRVVAR